MKASQHLPIVVDLDGTIIKTDTFFESLLILLKTNIFYLLLLPIWCYKGNAYCKKQIAQRIQFEPALLPYDQPFLNYLYEQKKQGREIILATAADEIIAHKVADYLNLFDRVLASNGQINLSGKNKLHAIFKFYSDFVYAGDHKVDLPIWQAAKGIMLLTRNTKLSKILTKYYVPIEYISVETKLQFKAFIKALRPHQWVKNLLIFIPLFAAHQLTNSPLLTLATIGFFAFCFCASSVYIINDLFDLPADRQHLQKKERPFATGKLSIPQGILGAFFLLVISFGLASMASWAFVIVLFIYLFLTLFYSLIGKKIELLDVVLLAMLYVIRVIAGGVITGLALSAWLLAFSLFFFFSLALMKRVTELNELRKQNKLEIFGRGYLAFDLEQIANFGTSSGYISVLVLALYINNEHVLLLYQHPQVLWLCCPLLLYWISRIWLLAHRGLMQDDPVMFAIKDKVSYIIGTLLLILLELAR